MVSYQIAPRNLPAQRWPASLKEILKRNFLLAAPSSISKVPSTPLGNRKFYMVFCANCPIYLVKILSSFQNARKAKLSSNGSSLRFEIKIGCPKGSVLSLFLWNVLADSISILDFRFPFPFKIFAYNDDLVLCFGILISILPATTYKWRWTILPDWHPDLDIYRNNLQVAMDTTTVWGTSVKLVFNTLKTIYMVFSRWRQPFIEYQPITVNETPVKASRSCTYLDLILDEKLTWREHITVKCVKVKRLLFIVGKCCGVSPTISK